MGRDKGHQEIREMVAKQMREWEKAKGQQAEHAHLAGNSDVTIDYITLSRQAGSGGRSVGEGLAKKLNWQLYDKEILDFMSEDMNVHKSMLEEIDEKTGNWIDNLLGPLGSKSSVNQSTYYRHLANVLLTIATHGSAIIIGRAAGLVLPRKHGLSVRITASFDERCRRYAERETISLRKAGPIIEKLDKAQKNFVKNMLGRDVEDPGNYDIVCNTDALSPDSVVKLVWRTLDQRKS